MHGGSSMIFLTSGHQGCMFQGVFTSFAVFFHLVFVGLGFAGLGLDLFCSSSLFSAAAAEVTPKNKSAPSPPSKYGEGHNYDFFAALFLFFRRWLIRGLHFLFGLFGHSNILISNTKCVHNEPPIAGLWWASRPGYLKV